MVWNIKEEGRGIRCYNGEVVVLNKVIEGAGWLYRATVLKRMLCVRVACNQSQPFRGFWWSSAVNTRLGGLEAEEIRCMWWLMQTSTVLDFIEVLMTILR